MSKLNLKEGTTPPTPASGEISVYVKTDKNLYIKDDTGLETGVTTDTKVKISATDTTSDYLSPKLAAGTGISLAILNPGANEQVEISTTAEANTASNIGGEKEVFKQKTGVDLEFRTLKEGANITITQNANDLTIDASAAGEANTASNVGTGGVGVFKQKTGVDLEFRNINASSSKVSVVLDGVNNEIDLDVVEANLTLGSIGGTLPISKGGTGQTAQTAAFNALSPNTTKGDLSVHNGTNNVRQAVGVNNSILIADSTQASGVRWKAQAAKEVFFNWRGENSNFGNYRTYSIGAAGNGRTTFKVPDDFGTLVSIELIGSPSGGAAAAARDIDLSSSYGAVGELTTNHSQTDTTTLYNLAGTDGRWAAISVATVFTSLAAGDYAGIFVDHKGIGGTIEYMGIKLKYNPV